MEGVLGFKLGWGRGDRARSGREVNENICMKKPYGNLLHYELIEFLQSLNRGFLHGCLILIPEDTVY